MTINHGIRFTSRKPILHNDRMFNRLLNLFQDMFLATSGDLSASFSWLNELDRRFRIFPENYRLPDFIRDLIERGYIKEEKNKQNSHIKTSKLEKAIRLNAFHSLFGKMSRSKSGKHSTSIQGKGDDLNLGLKPYEFGDSTSLIAPAETIYNAMVRSGSLLDGIEENDLLLFDTHQQSNCCTVLLVDISHSMILYGEDRITPAKKVALALTQMIRQYYPKDQLHVVVFGDDACEIPLNEIPYIEVGPYHTNTVAALQLSIQLLEKSRSGNKNIMMLTDGKPSCIKRGKEYYKNPYGLDPYIIQRTLAQARKCRKRNIQISTFMLSDDPSLIEFVEQFSKEAQGKAFYTHLNHLGDQIFLQYKNNHKKKS